MQRAVVGWSKSRQVDVELERRLRKIKETVIPSLNVLLVYSIRDSRRPHVVYFHIYYTTAALKTQGFIQVIILWINTMKIYTSTLLVFVTQVVFTQANCISKTAKVFDNNCYELFTISMNWTEAQKFCSRFNGTRSLAKVSSPSVLNFLNSLRPNNTLITSDTRVWLGASDQLKEGEWVWTDGTKADLTSMWRDGEPNGGSWRNEDCLDIFQWGNLNDENCSLAFPFICMEVHETSTTSKTETTKTMTSKPTTARSSFTTEGNVSESGIYGYLLETSTTSKTMTSKPTTARSSFTTEGNVSKSGIYGYLLETTTKSETNTNTDPTSMPRTEIFIFTTERKMPRNENVSVYTLENMNSLGLAEGIGIGIGIGVVVTLSVLAVVLAIIFRRKTPPLKESGNSTDIENQTKQNTACGKITGTEVEDGKQVELNLYADVLDLQEQNTAYDNMTRTDAGSVRLVEPKETKHLYAEFLNKQGGCYINS